MARLQQGGSLCPDMSHNLLGGSGCSLVAVRAGCCCREPSTMPTASREGALLDCLVAFQISSFGAPTLTRGSIGALVMVGAVVSCPQLRARGEECGHSPAPARSLGTCGRHHAQHVRASPSPEMCHVEGRRNPKIPTSP